ncbi:MAG: flagellar assembly protein FliW [Synergistaceae bacterium]|nr:flagellar assembly protein FliW [Synergistaceae bacterium]MBQ6968693.1 flagellar assembly protein FliW [Synergistaceae bacterium]MBQ7267556.1 flagellar assembly protein FliW [Synergistaceae bacterium]
MPQKKIETSRFGTVSYSEEEILFFPRGIPAFESKHEWILAGTDDSAVKWLQSLDDGELALPVTSPDAVQPDYNARIPEDELKLIDTVNPSELALLIVVSIPDSAPWNMTANLRAPILINLKTHKAVQVIALNEDYPIRHMVFPEDVREKMKASAMRNGGDE